MKNENSIYWIWLAEKCGIASKEFGRLAEKYENPFDLYRLDEDEIEQLEGIGRALKSRLAEKSLESSYAILRYCRQNGVSVIGYHDRRYPARLRSIENPPVLLYVLGRIPDWNSRLCIGMVGTRKMSEYGQQTAYKISYELSAANALIVSGMALGVDGVSACGALAAGGETVAVLGCGISVVYPKEHTRLKEEILRHGAVITEYPPTERPIGSNFPKRNRIISGLCQGVLVVEGAVGSGALITAKWAVEQGRELFALPGQVNESNSEGPNELIRNGAHVALCADDILCHYDFLYHDVVNYKGLAKAKKKKVPEETTLQKYGVSALYYRGRYGEAPVKRREAEKHEKDANSAPQTVAKTAPMASHLPVSAREEISAASGSAVSAAATDDSAAVMAGLDPITCRVFAHMPLDRAVSPDQMALPDVAMGELMTSLTLLELSGLISSLPGGLYTRK
ncbi:MAG: DNA-processing protein DprA [Clostridia bacterium]|nr:DNA-processing protein DprA [Clostridia bacterium]